MECHLEADPPPDIIWHHAGTPISAGPRVLLSLTNLQGNSYKANLIIKVSIFLFYFITNNSILIIIKIIESKVLIANFQMQ